MTELKEAGVEPRVLVGALCDKFLDYRDKYHFGFIVQGSVLGPTSNSALWREYISQVITDGVVTGSVELVVRWPKVIVFTKKLSFGHQVVSHRWQDAKYFNQLPDGVKIELNQVAQWVSLHFVHLIDQSAGSPRSLITVS